MISPAGGSFLLAKGIWALSWELHSTDTAAFLCPHPTYPDTCISLCPDRAFLASTYDATQHPSITWQSIIPLTHTATSASAQGGLGRDFPHTDICSPNSMTLCFKED